MNKFSFVFFGTDEFAVQVLDRLDQAGWLPEVVITTPDTPQGRKLKLTPSPVKQWTQSKGLRCLTPASLKQDFLIQNHPELLQANYDFFLVASYGKILPVFLLNVPSGGTLNIHPSLLPKYRGPSPIQSAILAGDKETGVTIMVLDQEMDHGPILSQKKIPINHTDDSEKLKEKLAHLGAEILIEIIPGWLKGEISATEQDHNQATYTSKFTKSDGEINLQDNSILNYRKFQALRANPGIYFFQNVLSKNRRIKITQAHLANDEFIIDRVIPEGKKEMAWEDYRRNI